MEFPSRARLAMVPRLVVELVCVLVAELAFASLFFYGLFRFLLHLLCQDFTSL
jgi:hypothetical protein